MAGTKYGKYFVSGAGTRKAHPLPNKIVAYLDGDSHPGSNFYLFMRVPTTPENPDIYGKTWGKFSAGPHTHPCAEILTFIGTNPDDPADLGGEVELCMGEEMEKHTITKSTTVFIPAGMIHCPWTIKRVDRPFTFIQILQAPHQFSKSYTHLVPEKERQYLITGDIEYGKVPSMSLPKLRP